MTVTKQQQLEWLAKEFDAWPGFGGVPIRMSSVATGEVNNGLGIAHHIRMEEWQQERVKMSSKPEVDNSWHERGELPPVGCECEIKHKCWGGFQRVTVVAITKEYAIVEDDSVVAREQHYHLHNMTFRPLRTEREKAVEEMANLIAKSVFGSAKCQAEKLYDAGYRKVKP